MTRSPGPHPVRRNPQQGFSLLEVLVAFAVLALSLGVLTQVFTSGMRNTQLSSRYSEAMILAESRLAAATVPGELEEGTDNGEAEGFNWVTEAAPFDTGSPFENPAVKPLRVSVRVSWNDRGQSRSLELVTLRLGQDGI